MIDRIFGPFANATREALKLLLDIDATADILAAQDGVSSGEDKIDIMIGLTGDITGEIHYLFSKETTLEMVKIMSGMEIGGIDDFVTSAVGEIANIISGNAITGLSEQNVVCDILPPQITAGGFSASGTGNYHTLNACIHTEIGDIDLCIQLALQKSA